MLRSSADPAAARRGRERAARRFRPAHVTLLLVAEGPPNALDRYFYFTDVQRQDSLFRYVVKGLLGAEPTRANKKSLLERLEESGVFLIDLWEDPVDGGSLAAQVPDLIERCRALAPERIILIKTTVYDIAHRALREAGLPVVDERIPFPGSGQHRKFEEAFARALAKSPVERPPVDSASMETRRRLSAELRGPQPPA